MTDGSSHLLPTALASGIGWCRGSCVDGERRGLRGQRRYAKPGCAYSVCTDGKRRSPPEDCGGLGGYYNLLESHSRSGTRKSMRNCWNGLAAASIQKPSRLTTSTGDSHPCNATRALCCKNNSLGEAEPAANLVGRLFSFQSEDFPDELNLPKDIALKRELQQVSSA